MAHLITPGKSALVWGVLGTTAYNASEAKGTKKALALAVAVLVGGHVLTQLAINGRTLNVAKGALSSLVRWETLKGIFFARLWVVIE